MGASLLDHAHTLTTHIGPTCDAKAPPLHLQNLGINDGLLGLGPLAKPLELLQGIACSQPGGCGPFNLFQHCLAILLAIAQGSAEVMQCLLLLLQEPMICLVMAQWLAILTKGAMVQLHFKNVFHKCIGHTSQAWACELAALPGIGIALGVALPLPVVVGAWHDAIIDHTCHLQSTHAFHMFDNTCWQRLMPRMHWHWIALGHWH